MGPGDVERVLRSVEGDLGALRVDKLPPPEPYRGSPDVSVTELPPGASLAVAGRNCRVRFSFYKGALFRVVMYSPFEGQPASTVQERLAWRDKVASLLTQKYGNPSGVDETPGWRGIDWKNESSAIWALSVDSIDGDTSRSAAAFGYLDPVRAKLAEDGDPADKDKL
jgi:hypothetical protein